MKVAWRARSEPLSGGCIDPWLKNASSFTRFPGGAGLVTFSTMSTWPSSSTPTWSSTRSRLTSWSIKSGATWLGQKSDASGSMPVKARYVVGAFAGPPCETWSQARGRPATSRQPGDHGTHHGPRIVRTCEELWGRAAMALREVLQVDTGNLLLMFTLELLIHLAIQGGVGGLEHLAPPSDPSLASIWRLPLLSFLMSWPEFNFIEVSQGLWGAPSRKPTGLLLLNLHRMIPVLRQWQLASEIPKGTSIGVNEAGFWATSYLKEYPPAFCGGLAGGFLASLHEHKVDETMHIDGNFWQRALSMVVNTMGACAGPDFAN